MTDCKAPVHSTQSPLEAQYSKTAKPKLPTEVKMPELRKPEMKLAVKNPKKKISTESPPSEPVKKTVPINEVVQKSELKISAPIGKTVDDSKLSISEKTSLPMNVSNSTGLNV